MPCEMSKGILNRREGGADDRGLNCIMILRWDPIEEGNYIHLLEHHMNVANRVRREDTLMKALSGLLESIVKDCKRIIVREQLNIIIYKMDKFGQGVEFQYSLLQKNKELNFMGFTKQMVLEMCILSGCDYLQSVPGMGLKRAHALIKKFKTYEKVIKHLRYNTLEVPTLYEESFKKAIWTFQYQRVYDPCSQDIVHLSIPNEKIDDDSDFLGPMLAQHIAKGIAEGELDPFTKLPFQASSQNAEWKFIETYASKDLKVKSEKKKLDLPVQKNVLTKYFCFASLEAKRKFKAPRFTKEDVNTFNGLSPRLVDDAPDAVAVCANSSPSSLLDAGNVDSTPTDDSQADANDSMDTCAFFSKNNVLLPPTSHEVHKPSTELHKDENYSSSDASKIGKEARKIIVRSSYFQHKPINDEIDNCKENLAIRNGTARVSCSNSIFDDPLFGKYTYKSRPKKRKADFIESTSNVNEEFECSHTDTMSRPSNISTMSDEKVVGRKVEEKFGSNISHLSQYSDIAEKSVEKFVSVISKFTYSSSGSRASGLRAPLKDVENTCLSRHTPKELDLSKFVYISSSKKPAPSTHGC